MTQWTPGPPPLDAHDWNGLIMLDYGEWFGAYVEGGDVFTHCSTKIEPSRITHHMPIEEPSE